MEIAWSILVAQNRQNGMPARLIASQTSRIQKKVRHQSKHQKCLSNKQNFWIRISRPKRKEWPTIKTATKSTRNQKHTNQKTTIIQRSKQKHKNHAEYKQKYHMSMTTCSHIFTTAQCMMWTLPPHIGCSTLNRVPFHIYFPAGYQTMGQVRRKNSDFCLSHCGATSLTFGTFGTCEWVVQPTRCATHSSSEECMLQYWRLALLRTFQVYPLNPGLKEHFFGSLSQPVRGHPQQLWDAKLEMFCKYKCLRTRKCFEKCIRIFSRLYSLRVCISKFASEGWLYPIHNDHSDLYTECSSPRFDWTLCYKVWSCMSNLIILFGEGQIVRDTPIKQGFSHSFSRLCINFDNTRRRWK